jgi:hypothetical protein
MDPFACARHRPRSACLRLGACVRLHTPIYGVHGLVGACLRLDACVEAEARTAPAPARLDTMAIGRL